MRFIGAIALINLAAGSFEQSEQEQDADSLLQHAVFFKDDEDCGSEKCQPHPQPPTKPPIKPPVKPVTTPAPSVNTPPVTQPPVTQPPVTRPPVTQPPVTRPPVSQVAIPDLNFPAYVGRWYQTHVSLSAPFQTGATCVTADYGVAADEKTVTVKNTNRYNGGGLLSVEGYGAPNPDGSGELQVVLGRPGHPVTGIPVWGDANPVNYVVAAVGPKVDGMYDYAIVTEPAGSILYVLARDVARFEAQHEAKVLQQAADLGFTGLNNSPHKTPQDNCTYSDANVAPQPPVTQPPVTQPPVTQPPVTQPPVTRPPVTQPPVTQPPVTQPPVDNDQHDGKKGKKGTDNDQHDGKKGKHGDHDQHDGKKGKHGADHDQHDGKKGKHGTDQDHHDGKKGKKGKL